MVDLRADWDKILSDDLTRLRESHLYRHRRIVTPVDATHVEWEGRRYINFGSNNYLGLTHHPDLLTAAEQALRREGLGSGAAALISGYTESHASLERRIARWKGTEAAVVLPSGYQANLAVVQTLASLGSVRGGVRFLVDKLAHASIIDAVRGTGWPLRIFPHNNMAKLKRLLEADTDALPVVITESIFSMDGDAADLAGIVALKQAYPFLLVLDEAHASGVYGKSGAGYAAELGVQAAIDVSVITLSKAVGCAGGAACASKDFCESLVNHGRAYIFSTNMPPPVATAAQAAIDIMEREPARQARVRDLAIRVRRELSRRGVAIPPGDSPIIPIILKEAASALAAAEKLREKGIFVIAVRPPSVPRGSSRLRITLSSEHTDQEVEALVREVIDLNLA